MDVTIDSVKLSLSVFLPPRHRLIKLLESGGDRSRKKKAEQRLGNNRRLASLTLKISIVEKDVVNTMQFGAVRPSTLKEEAERKSDFGTWRNKSTI